MHRVNESVTALAQLCGAFSSEPKEKLSRPEVIQQTASEAAEASQTLNLELLNWKKWKRDLPETVIVGDNPAGARGGEQRARPSAPR